MKEGFIMLDGQDKPQKIFYEPKQKANNKSNKVAKIRNRYNQVPHLTQDTHGKVTNSQKTPQTRAGQPFPSR